MGQRSELPLSQSLVRVVGNALLPAVACIGVAGLFALGAPGAGAWGPAIATGGPYVEVVGHYVPKVQGPQGTVSIGAGSLSDLRLTEPDVADTLGTLVATEDGFHYTHGGTASNAAFYGIGGGTFAGVTDHPDALVAARDGLRLVMSDTALFDNTACTAEGPWQAVTLDLVDATGLWVRDGHGERRTLEVPAVAGAWRPVADGALLWDGSHLWLTPTPPVGTAVPEGSALIAGTLARWFGGALSIVPAPLDADFATHSGLARAVPGVITPDLALAGNRFVKPDAYVRWEGVEPKAIGVTGESSPIDPAFHVFRRRPRAESSVPLVWTLANASAAIFGENASDAPRVGRSPGYAGHLYECVDAQLQPIGEIDLTEGDVMLAGHSTWAVGDAPGHGIELILTEAPSHRVHALASLSSGKLNATNAHFSVPDCAKNPTDPRRSLVLRGVTDAALVPEGVETDLHPPFPAPGQDIAKLALPAWAAKAHPDVQQRGRLEVDLLEMCVGTDGDLRILEDRSPPGHPLTELSGNRVAPGGTLGAAGHTLRFASARPALEQALPLVGFTPLVLLLCGLAGIRLARSAGPRATAASRHAPLWAVSGFGALLVVGALLQMRMAATESLLGSADYLQRHLLTSYLAAAGLFAATDLSLVWPDLDARGRAWRLAGHGRITSTLLLGWLGFDRLMYAWLGPDSVPAGTSVTGDLNRTLALVAGLALATWVAPLVIAVLPWSRLPKLPAVRFPEVDLEDNSRWGRVRTLILGAITAPGVAAQPLLVGAAVLAIGVLIGGSGRSFGGFDLKLAEFAPLPVGLGLAGLLVNWSRIGSSWGRIAVVAGTLGWLGGVTFLVVALYALRGDLGPLMVLVPAMFGTVCAWVLPWRAGPTAIDDAKARGFVLGGYLGLIGLGFFAVYAAVPLVQEHLTEIPSIGTHVERALQRFETHGSTWYTEGGHWSTTAEWIAAGYYETGEHYVSNLHSDLAFVALMQSFHVVRAIVALALFAGLVALLVRLGEVALQRSETQWTSAFHRVQEQAADREARRRYSSVAVPAYLEVGITGYFLIFTGLYLAAEVLVHVGTCFNTLPQTGITLPWVSSGGSASVGFAILLGAALARASRATARLDAVRDEA